MPEVDSSPDVTAVVGPASQLDAQAFPLLGTQLSAGQLLAERFEVRALAGVGGMGAVYRAWDRVTNSTVALKILSGQSADEERFLREARVLSTLEHPSIVRYVAHGLCGDGTPYLAMEWLDGTDLATRILRHPLTLRESVSLMERVASALGLAHSRGIVHRDLSPRNLFLVHGSVTDVRVLDFGIAMLGSLATRITVTGSAIGTPGYMAPEQAQGASLITPAADVFALGCVLFECISGRRAFAGRTLMELLAKILVDDVPHLSALGVRVPPELDRLVASMLEKRAEARPRDGNAVAEALRELSALEDARPEPGQSVRASLTAVEQRVVSVILASDPAANAEGEGEVVEAIGEVVAPFGARVEPLANGCVVVTVGARSGPDGGRANATDRVVQAARCALAMRQRFPRLPLALGTGRSIVSGRWPAGQAIERASSFLHTQTDAEAGPSSGVAPIFVDDVTAGLLDARFDVRGDQRGLMLRGLRDALEPVRTLLGKPTPMVGRNRELLTLEATYEECASESVARVVLLSCPAGFGKSRLAEEFLKKLRLADAPPEIWRAQADPLSKGSPFALIAQTIRHASGILEGEDVAVRRQKLRARVARNVGEAEVGRISEFMGELIGAPFPDENSPQLRAARNDAVLLGDQMLRAFEDWLQAESEQSPLMLVLDDLHWGDLPSVRFIDSALRKLAERPLMVVAMARPEVHELFPNLWSRRGMLELRLPELSRKAAETLARQVLAANASETVIERIVARAGGNALWLEELLRAEVEGRGHETSDTVMVLAQARLEALDSDARLVLRAASVFGQRFSAGGVRALTSQVVLELEPVLSHLVEREIIVARAIRGGSAQREYEFRNALFREAAYATLTDEDRELGHLLAAAWLKETGDVDALVLAEHFERAGRPESAVEWYLRSGQQALEGSDLEAAVLRAQRGIDSGASREQRGLLRLLQAEACKWQGKNADGQRFALEAIDCLVPESPAWCAAVGEAAAASGKLGDLERCAPLSQALLDARATPPNACALLTAMSRSATQLVLAGASDLASRLLGRVETTLQSIDCDPATLGWVFEARAVSAGTGRDPSARVSLAEEAARKFTLAGDLRNACLQETSLGFACVETGANAQAEQALTSALALGERLGLSNSIPIARAHLGRALARRGETQRARSLLEQAVQAFDEQGNQRLGGMARCYLSQVLLEVHEYEPARRAAREAVLMLESIPAFRRSSLAALAAVSLARGALEDARESSEAAVSGLGRHDEVSFGESLVRLVYAETLHGCGEIEAARTALRIAHDRLMERAGRIADPERRRAFLEGVPENARTLALIAEWKP
ncbi:MAG: protein kinase domain-containing protein [Myxococcota bacterium]